jgi:hypothetical protein
VTLSDQKFRNVAVAQFGPGKGNGPSGRDDFWRMNISGLATEQYAELRDFFDHYSESDVKLATYDVSQIDPSLRGTLLQNANDILATTSGALKGLVLTQQQIDDLTAYLRGDGRRRRLSSMDTASNTRQNRPMESQSKSPYLASASVLALYTRHACRRRRDDHCAKRRFVEP